jgi:hypothetical protein
MALEEQVSLRWMRMRRSGSGYPQYIYGWYSLYCCKPAEMEMNCLPPRNIYSASQKAVRIANRPPSRGDNFNTVYYY